MTGEERLSTDSPLRAAAAASSAFSSILRAHWVWFQDAR